MDDVDDVDADVDVLDAVGRSENVDDAYTLDGIAARGDVMLLAARLAANAAMRSAFSFATFAASRCEPHGHYHSVLTHPRPCSLPCCLGVELSPMRVVCISPLPPSLSDIMRAVCISTHTIALPPTRMSMHAWRHMGV